MINFSVSTVERGLLRQAAQRAAAMDVEANAAQSRRFIEWEMDFTATHANGCPLDLKRLLAADDFNFAHDAFGIARHLNRETGQLENHFLPRFALKEAA